jgi:hypothetical protein
MQVRQEMYDDNGLFEVKFIEIDGPTLEEQIAEKEAQLLKIYAELNALKEQ